MLLGSRGSEAGPTKKRPLTKAVSLTRWASVVELETSHVNQKRSRSDIPMQHDATATTQTLSRLPKIEP